MTDTTLRFRSGEHTLVGTLSLPDGEGPFAAALLVPGSGPVDRDSNHKRMRLDITRQLAVALNQAGIATLRYDKRGVGESSGDFLRAGFRDNIDDAGAALAALAQAPGVDASRVVVVGHSEGALLATAVAAQATETGGDAGHETGPAPAGGGGSATGAGLATGGAPATGAAPRLVGVVLLSGSATPGEELLSWQAAQIAPTLPAPVRLLLRLLRTDLERKVAKNHARIKATTTDVARVDGARLNARWTREFMAYDPRADLARITAPVLAITGSKDLQTRPADLAVIARTVRGPVETHEVPDLNHILRPAAGPATLSSYRKDVRQPVDRRVLDLVVGWTRRTVAAAAQA